MPLSKLACRALILSLLHLLLVPLQAFAAPITWGFTATVDYTQGAPPAFPSDLVTGTFTWESSIPPEPPFEGSGFTWVEYPGAFTMADLTVGTDHIVLSSESADTSLVRMTDYYDSMAYSMTGFLVSNGGATVNGEAANVGLSAGFVDNTYTAGSAFPTGLYTPYDEQSYFSVTLRDASDQIIYSVQASFDTVYLIPEPSTAQLIFLGLVAAAASRRGRSRSGWRAIARCWTPR